MSRKREFLCEEVMEEVPKVRRVATVLSSFDRDKYRFGLQEEVKLPLNNAFVSYNDSMHRDGPGILDDYPFVVQMEYTDGVLNGPLIIANVAEKCFISISLTKNNRVTEQIDLSTAEREIVDLDEDGTRWEGPAIDCSPCGWGRLFGKDNDLQYEGFLLGQEKACYGTVYHYGLDPPRVNYKGMLAKNQYCGRGCLINRLGECVYDGEWIGNSNTLAKNLVLSPGDSHPPRLHSLTESLECLSVAGSAFRSISLQGLWRLRSISIEHNCMSGFPSTAGLCCELADLPVLQTLSIGDHSFSMYTALALKSVLADGDSRVDLPSLTHLSLGALCFSRCRSLALIGLASSPR